MLCLQQKWVEPLAQEDDVKLSAETEILLTDLRTLLLLLTREAKPNPDKWMQM